MTIRFKTATRWIVILLSQIILTACAMGQPKYFFYSFSFNAVSDAKIYGKPEIDILDYKFGNSGQFGTHADPEAIALGHPINQHGIGGMMPRAEYLYVKWRIQATGEIIENKVDLTHRLPSDLTHYGVHFAIFGPQLYVYLFPPYTTKDLLGETIVHTGQPPGPPSGKTLLDIPFAQEHQIYPDVNK